MAPKVAKKTRKARAVARAKIGQLRNLKISQNTTTSNERNEAKKLKAESCSLAEVELALPCIDLLPGHLAIVHSPRPLTVEANIITIDL